MTTSFSLSGFVITISLFFLWFCKTIVESCVRRKFSDRLSSFDRCCSSLLRLLMAQRRSLLRIDKASLLETFGSLKIRNFGYTRSYKYLQYIAWKYGNVTVKDFWKYEKLEYKKNNLKLNIVFLNLCKHVIVYPKFIKCF